MNARLLALVGLAGAATMVGRAIFHRTVHFRDVRREQSRPSGRPVAPGEVRLSVIVPAYNEEPRIVPSVATIREQLSTLDAAGELEIVVVDDCSTDATAQAAWEAGANQVIALVTHRGKGAAVRAGVAAATGRTVAFTDADLAYAPRQLLSFLDAIESGFDIAIGSRHQAGSSAGTSALRSFGSRAVNLATNISLLGNYRDTQCGCKAFRSDVARVVFGAGIIDGFAFDIEVLYLAERYDLALVEIPVEVVNSDTSTVRAFRDGLSVVVDIVRVRATAQRGRYPSLGAMTLPPPESESRD